MYYQVISGKDKGKVFIASEVNEEDDVITSQEGVEYFGEELRELTQEEIDKCFKTEKIF